MESKKTIKIKIIPKQKQMGMKVEREHNDVTHGDPRLIEKIVMAHLKEMPDYYSRLHKMEKEGEDALHNKKEGR